ncbi:hypothetical protein CYMTET_9758 [Cymbomonas tetramitiformis]|uniref:RNase III domain-containing protein n=1 Tax=Cymbomonas tetramitiformis TaxID=36881 RepID=A0AAE0GQJ4_9CHLO|nr:hypothetical protein CYMTET_9758 [Cymbomonas tetramitiformis]
MEADDDEQRMEADDDEQRMETNTPHSCPKKAAILAEVDTGRARLRADAPGQPAAVARRQPAPPATLGHAAETEGSTAGEDAGKHLELRQPAQKRKRRTVEGESATEAGGDRRKVPGKSQKMKCVADCVEAVIGAVYDVFGEDGARRVAYDMGLLHDRQVETAMFVEQCRKLDEQRRRHSEGVAEPDVKDDATCGTLCALEETLRYKFRSANEHGQLTVGRTGRLALLDEALTHASARGEHPLPCYQRLEYLGDAVLDLLVARHFHYSSMRSLRQGHLTNLRQAVVSNARLATVALELRLPRYLRHSSHVLHKEIETFAKSWIRAQAASTAGESLVSVDFSPQDPSPSATAPTTAPPTIIDSEALQASSDEAKEVRCGDENVNTLTVTQGEEHRVQGFLEQEAPKLLGDVVESIAGAVLLDCGFNLTTVWQIFQPLLKPQLTEARNSTALLHEVCSKRKLGTVLIQCTPVTLGLDDTDVPQMRAEVWIGAQLYASRMVDDSNPKEAARLATIRHALKRLGVNANAPLVPEAQRNADHVTAV